MSFWKIRAYNRQNYTKKSINLSNILIATHTFDIYGKQISKYDFSKIRFIHIDEVRIQ